MSSNLWKHSRLISLHQRAARFEERYVQAAYYLEPDHGETYCESCAHKEAARRHGSEVWCADQSADHDVEWRCDSCGCWLAGWLTTFGAEDVLAHLKEDGFHVRRGEDCYVWTLCENAFATDGEDYRALLKLAGVSVQELESRR